MKRRIFISHKNNGLSNSAGGAIGKKLQSLEHDVFLDIFSLEAGMNWNNEIIDSLIASEVLIVVVDSETAESNWVQREIDMARAQSISILPVILEDFSVVQPSFKRFELEKRQFFHYKATHDPDEINAMLDEIVRRIDPLAIETDINQQQAYAVWNQRRMARNPQMTPGRKRIMHTLVHPDAEGIQFHITAGDASLTRDFDILVNTENNYMQMARFFETSTLSYAIRTNGAYIQDGVRLREDTVQEQLYSYATHSGGLPVVDTQVLMTSAGHEKSNIRRFTDYKYILHACAVRVSLANKSVAPIEPISRIIVNCMRKVADLDMTDGAIVLENGDVLFEAEGDYQQPTSILFPVFGAGYGGKDLSVAMNQIVNTFTRQVPESIDNFKLGITDVGMSIFFEENVPMALDIFHAAGFEDA